MLEYLAALDIKIFRFINTDLSCSLLDRTMPLLTDLHKSIPAIAVGLLAVVFWIAKGRKRAMAIIAVIFFAAAFADLLNAFTMKTQF